MQQLYRVISYPFPSLTLPLGMGLTYTGDGQGADHVLTYTAGKLAWDGSAAALPESDGACALNIGGMDAQGCDMMNGLSHVPMPA